MKKLIGEAEMCLVFLDSKNVNLFHPSGLLQNRQVPTRGQQIEDRESKPNTQVFYETGEPLQDLRSAPSRLPQVRFMSYSFS